MHWLGMFEASECGMTVKISIGMLSLEIAMMNTDSIKLNRPGSEQRTVNEQESIHGLLPNWLFIGELSSHNLEDD